MPFKQSSEQLKRKFLDIHETYTEIHTEFVNNINSIPEKLKQKYLEFVKNYTNLYNRKINGEIDDKYVHSIVNLREKIKQNPNQNLDEFKEFIENNPDVYQGIIAGDTLHILKTLHLLEQDIRQYVHQYENEYTNKKDKAKIAFIRKYKKLLHEARYKMLLKGWINQSLDYKTTMAMLGSYDKLQSNELSNHDASLEFGTYMADTHLKPLLEEQKRQEVEQSQ